MVTLHPSAMRLHDGSYRPAVIVRDPRGHCVGSRVSHVATFSDKEAARTFARNAAHKVAASLEFTRVS